MALKPCRECGREVSTDAKSCPHCGVSAPAGKPFVDAKGIGCLLFLLVIGWCGYGAVRTAVDVASAPTSPAARSSASPVIEAKGELKVDRVWVDDQIDTGWALLSYKNNTSHTFDAWLTARCDALGAGETKIGTNTRSFFANEHGPIRPGFTGTLKVPVDLNGAAMESMRCWIESAR